jgi:hypothetical protein
MMTKNNDILDSIHAHRVKNQEKLKGKTDKEVVDYYNSAGRRIAKKFGFEHLLCDDSPTMQKSLRV